MSHVRTQIRQAAAAALASVGVVSVSRVYPVGEAELPILLVHTNTETLERGPHGAYQRELGLVIEAVTKGEYFDDDLDTLIVGVEQALNGSKLGGICKPLALTAISILTEAGAVPIGRARLEYRVIYFTEYTTPETAL